MIVRYLHDDVVERVAIPCIYKPKHYAILFL